jgi:drug/metabolite transporter (DMT)-like permease
MSSNRLTNFIFALKNYRAALVAAVFFGCIAPGVKYLTNSLPPQSMAGVLYFSAGIGLLAILIVKNEFLKSFKEFQKKDRLWLSSAIFFGGILGPAFLTYGLMKMSGATTSLLLNLESVLTSLIAWFIFKEHFEKKIVWGMLFIVTGCLILSVGSTDQSTQDSLIGFLFISLACLSWGIDNNVTRNISHLNPLFTASMKGLVAGFANLSLGYFIGEKLHLNFQLFQAALLGFLGIGVSLVAFILSLGKIGTARTGALFSTAPFIGSILSILILKEEIYVPFVLALALMACGVWFHLSENHEHEHTHDVLEHSHEHVHDEHHQHTHSTNDTIEKSHSHLHKHEKLVHKHSHFPDIHHQHSH